jgi:hypothetical protein
MGAIFGVLLGESRRPAGKSLDAMCNRFQEEWAAGQRPGIEERLADTPASDQPGLFRRLFELELKARREGGEQPSVREYQERFPDYLALVEEVFASEETPRPHSWKPSGAKAPTTSPAHTPSQEKSFGGTLGVQDFVGSAPSSPVALAAVQASAQREGTPEDLHAPNEETPVVGTSPHRWSAAGRRAGPDAEAPTPPLQESENRSLGVQDFARSASHPARQEPPASPADNRAPLAKASTPGATPRGWRTSGSKATPIRPSPTPRPGE